MKADYDDIQKALASINLPEGWFDTLIESENLTTILAELANQGNITNTTFKKARMNLPSFSDEKWSNIAPYFGLPPKPSQLYLPTFTTPLYLLPPTFHETNFTLAWQAQDVYHERSGLLREEARVKILDPYIISILALFHGKVSNSPGGIVTDMQYSSGGDVEHKILMINGILFLIIELKPQMEKNLAQLFLELLAAAERNLSADFTNLRIYGLLTDLGRFEFYSYNPLTKRFNHDEIFNLGPTREQFCFGMIHVTNKIFSMILNGYVEGLESIISKSLERGSIWEFALERAKECCTMFKLPFKTTDDFQKNGEQALELLAQSVHLTPRFYEFTGSEDDSSLEKLRTLAHQKVREWHWKKLQHPNCNPLYPAPVYV